MGIWSRIRKTFRGDRHSAEIQEELQFHLDMDTAEGHNRREARLRLGNTARIEEETRSMGIVEWLDSALQDARYGLRQLRKTPALASAIVLSLTVGVGANTAIFSLVDAAILKPLPVNNPDSLRIVEWTSDAFPAGASNINGEFSRISGGRIQASSVGANLYRRLAREQSGFAALMGVGDPDSAAIAVDASSAEQVSLQHVSANFFQDLGVMPVAGRPFRDEEDRVGQEPVVIVSHRFWMRRFGGGHHTIEDTLDRQIRVNNVPARIVGVAPAGFFGLRAGQWTDVYAPLAARVAFQPGKSGGAPRGEDDRDWWVRQVARLKPGSPETVARTQISALFRRLAVPEGTKVEPRKIPELITLPGRRGFNALSARDAGALWILMLLVGVLMLIVCANVANLLLSRSVGRERESAVRLALGASRVRLFRQYLIESGVFALLGGAAGLALGYVLASSVHLLFQSGRDASNAFDLHLNLRVLGYTGALSILTALLFGLTPALRGARADLGDALKAQTRSVLGGRLRLPRLLVSIQIALCLTALVAAGLLTRSLANLKWTEVGFDRENLAYASVSPSQAGYSVDRLRPYADRIREALSRLPGVIQVSAVQARLLSGNGNISRVNIPGRPSRIEKGIVNEADAIQRNAVGDGFFETLRIPLLAGRRIERRDIGPKAEAVVIDELFAKRFFPNQNPLGRRFGLDAKDNNRYEIVGVVGNVRYMSLRSDAYPTVYEPYVPRGAIHFAIRTTMDSSRLTEAVRKAVASVDPAVPLTEFHTQTGLIDRMLRTERLLSFMSGSFGLVALTLAAIGLGGLLAYAVARRTNEIGVRMALGAGAGDVMRMVWRDSFWMVGAGTLMGIPCAYVIGRVLKSALFRLEPFDPWTAAISFMALLAVAIFAAWVPARRAARIDPMVALREE
jgi:predicted permease